MSKKKLRKIAKNITNQPKIKKEIATFLVVHDISRPHIDDVMMFGHRGFLAMSEKELTDRFDKLYESFLVLKVKDDEIRSQHIANGYKVTFPSYYDVKIEAAEKLYDSIIDELLL